MNYDELLKELETVKNKNKLLEEELQETKEHLKKYTAPKRKRQFYENHREELLQKNKENQQKITQEKKKEYARKAYLKQKEKNEIKKEILHIFETEEEMNLKDR